MAHDLDRQFADRKTLLVLHDLGLSVGGDAGQIDQLVVHPFGVAIVESKSVTTAVRIDAQDDCERSRNARDSRGARTRRAAARTGATRMIDEPSAPSTRIRSTGSAGDSAKPTARLGARTASKLQPTAARTGDDRKASVMRQGITGITEAVIALGGIDGAGRATRPRRSFDLCAFTRNNTDEEVDVGYPMKNRPHARSEPATHHMPDVHVDCIAHVLSDEAQWDVYVDNGVRLDGVLHHRPHLAGSITEHGDGYRTRRTVVRDDDTVSVTHRDFVSLREAIQYLRKLDCAAQGTTTSACAAR